MVETAYVREMYTEDTGGGFVVNVLVLDDGSVLVIGEDSIVLYADQETWEERPGEQIVAIIRPGA